MYYKREQSLTIGVLFNGIDLCIDLIEPFIMYIQKSTFVAIKAR